MKSLRSNLIPPKYRADIDGLRAVAVLSVVGYHAFPGWIYGGFIGVGIFFVISGFLISTIILENLGRDGFDFLEFYSRRVLRIFPALLVVLVACFAFGWYLLLANEYRQLGKHIAAGAGFISNFVFWDESSYFDNAAETKPLLHLWSLGIEEQFYIMWPLLLWAAWRLKLNYLSIIAIIAFISFALNLRGVGKDVVATFYSPQTRFWELLLGSLLAYLKLYGRDISNTLGKNLHKVWLRIVSGKASGATGGMPQNLVSLLGLLSLTIGLVSITKESLFPGIWLFL